VIKPGASSYEIQSASPKIGFEFNRASQFSRYLLETAGSLDQDTNARASAVKLNKNSYSRAFVAF
jgi:hypothetical protein